jgi:voltage-gated potassium channel
LKIKLYNKHLKGLLGGIFVLVCVQVGGTLGYHYIGRPTATWIDSFYMTFITIATIGYGETVDLTHHPYGRLFTVFIGLIGIGTLTYLFSALVAVLVDTDLNAALRRKRMDKKIAEMKGHYIVCGIGRVGSNVGQELQKTHRKFVVIESDKEALDNWLEHHPHMPYLHDDAAEDQALLRAGVAHAAGVFAVTGDDSHNLMVALSVKLINPNARVVVRLHDIRNANKARKAGADEIVSPDFTGGMRIASAMLRPHVVNFMDQMLHSDDGLRVEEVPVPPGYSEVTLGELVPKAPEYLLMATHEAGCWVFNPADDHVVKSGVVLVLMATPGGRAQLEQRLKA